MKKCKNCQTEVADSSNFCHICGGSDFSPVEAEPVPEVIPEEIPHQAAPEEPVAEPNPGSYYTDSGVTVPPAAPKKKPSKGLIIGIAAGAVALIAVIVVAIILLNPVRRFMNAIKDGDSPAAAEIYYESIITNDDRAEKVYAELSAYADEQLQKYLAGEISYDELTSSLWAIDAASVYNETVYSALEQASSVNNWRQIYADAEEAFADGNYALAINLYSKVAGLDFESGEEAAAKLVDATSLYRSEVLDAVTAYQTDHAYESAYALLNEAFAVLPNDAALESAYAACLQAEYDYTIDCIIAEAQVYYTTNDYLGAIAYLDERIAVYPDEVRLQDERNACLGLFETYAINESYRLASEEDYVHAASLAASALEYVTSPSLTELYQIYLSYIPVKLGDMEIFLNETRINSLGATTNKLDQYLTDSYSNTYAHSLSAGCGTLTYLVNFKYKTFSGTVAFPKELTANTAHESATLIIYGDGHEIATFRDVTDDTKPKEFTLDISSYEKISLEWTCEGYNAWRNWGDFATIFDGTLIPIPIELPASVG